jgi:cellulose synthase/poly-beta-1,6-N-acetylglucosamine synthase-like glycosyltransferase
VVLVPAHNEADFIGRCLETLHSQDYPPDLFEVAVIADNCTDATASIAASTGARVLVRDDPEAPGKGPALRWAMDQVLAQARPPDAVVVVDADTVAAPGLLGALATRLEAGADAVQGEYLALPDDDSPGATLRAAGFLLFHKVRFSGRAALGLPCNLVGNGMLFSRRLLEEMPWGAFTSAEDLEYSVDLRLAGFRPVYAHDASLRAPLPSSGRAASVQRLRWEGGRFHVVRTRLPKLVREIAVGRRWSLLDAAVDLAVPPLGVLALVAAAGTAASSLLVISGAGPVWIILPWVVASASIPAFVLGGLASAEAPAATYRALALAPKYVASSLLTRLRLLGGLRADTWERTERPSDTATTGTHSKSGNGPSST